MKLPTKISKYKKKMTKPTKIKFTKKVSPATEIWIRRHRLIVGGMKIKGKKPRQKGSIATLPLLDARMLVRRKQAKFVKTKRRK